MDAVGLGEIRGPAGALRELGGAAPELEIARELVEGAEDDLERRARRLELLLLDVGELAVEREAHHRVLLGLEAHAHRLRLAARVADLGVLGLEHRGGADPRLGPIEQAPEQRDGLGVVLGGGERAHARLEGRGRFVEPVEVEPRELDFAPSAPLALGEIAVLGHDLRGRLELARRGEQVRQRLQRLAAGRDRHHLPQQRDGLRGLAEDLFFERGPLLEHVGAILAFHLRGAELEQPAQIVLAAVGAEERVERVHRLDVGLVELHELAVSEHRFVELVELARVDLGDLEAERAGLVGGEALVLLQAGLDGLDEGSPGARRARPRLEQVEARPRPAGARRPCARGRAPRSCRRAGRRSRWRACGGSPPWRRRPRPP